MVSVLLALAAPAAPQSLQEGVDLVTSVSNDLLPGFLGALAVHHANVVIGPFGVASNLAMLLEAGSGKTRQEVLGALNVTLDDIATLRVGFKAYCDLFLVSFYFSFMEPPTDFEYCSTYLYKGSLLQAYTQNFLHH